MNDAGFERDCPRCEYRFVARSDRGICPSCQLFSRVDTEGKPVCVVRTYETVELNDWPYESVDENFALVLQGFADGGGPLYLAERYDGFPVLSVVHKQLTHQFDALRNSVERFVSKCTFHDSPNELLALSREYEAAERLMVLRWGDGKERFDLVGCFTSDGGSIDALLNGDAFWHPLTAKS